MKKQIATQLTYAGLEAMEHKDPRSIINRAGNWEMQLSTRTRVRRFNAITFIVRYFQTDILWIHSDGSYTLNTGGNWQASTLQRLSDYGPVLVTKINGELVFLPKNTTVDTFHDGITVDCFGKPIRRSA